MKIKTIQKPTYFHNIKLQQRFLCLGYKELKGKVNLYFLKGGMINKKSWSTYHCLSFPQNARSHSALIPYEQLNNALIHMQEDRKSVEEQKICIANTIRYFSLGGHLLSA